MSSVGVAAVGDGDASDVGVIEGALIAERCGGLAGVDDSAGGLTGVDSAGDNMGVCAICARVRGGVYLLIQRAVADGGFGQGAPGVVTR